MSKTHLFDPYQQFHFGLLKQRLYENDMSIWADKLPEHVKQGLSTARFGDLTTWLQAFEAMPNITNTHLSAGDMISVSTDSISDTTQSALRAALQVLIPWRKGPFELCGVPIDTEWRSDKKWQRLADAISPLQSRRVLDVGCGNGYHMWRMLGSGASLVVGVDPSPRFSVQFEMVKKLAGLDLPIHLVPCALEDVPRPLSAFDSVFSMGVLYHRKSPIDHLIELRDCLRPGGELILESIVISGDETDCLVPERRYGKMRNVWFLPSSAMILLWLRKLGFHNPREVDESVTSTDEQRRTEWMRFESLTDFLMPEDTSKTIEGHPAPRRAVILANKPN